MDSNQITKVVRHYLDKKGYRQPEHLLKDQRRVNNLETTVFHAANEEDASISNYFSYGEGSGIAFDVAYSSLKRWIENSLDLYKTELFTILYPVFVHCYLDMISRGLNNEAKEFLKKYKTDHSHQFESEIEKLAAISSPQHVKENAFAGIFRSNKYNLYLSGYSFDLFIAFLQESSLTSLLKIVNQYLNIKVYHGKPKTDELMEEIGITGHTSKEASSINSREILWGNISPDPAVVHEVNKYSKRDFKNHRQADQIQSLLQQIKKIKSEHSQNASVSPSRGRVPYPTSPHSLVLSEIEKLKELSKKVNLTAKNAPSISCITFHNTYEGLNCVDLSQNSELVVAGFSDSYVLVWNVKGEKLHALRPSTELARIDLKEIDDISLLKETTGSTSKKLIGHSGPVFAVKFSPDNKYLISASQDCTLRLWSMDTFNNLVCYRGHLLPVWDVDISPLGYYFASGSADKTARLWSTDNIHPLRIFAGHLSDVDCVKFHPNGNYVATGSSDRTVRLFDVQSGDCVRLFSGHKGGVSSLCFSPDGKFLVSGSQDSNIMIWDIASGKALVTLSGHEKTIYSVSFSQESSILSSSSADCTVKLWNIRPILYPSATENSTHASEPLASFPTKKTAIFQTQFSFRNVLFAVGAFSP